MQWLIEMATAMVMRSDWKQVRRRGLMTAKMATESISKKMENGHRVYRMASQKSVEVTSK